ncbi:hypothetical protein [Ferrovibrio sp.]|uniref:hypothetical protein n=1 Tax=Ferrovibrio sp. TaxID=1917215 RepID=UPI0035AF5038
MRGKTWAILLVAAVAVGGGAWYITAQRDRATQADFATKPLFPDLAKRVNDVAVLELETTKGKIRIQRSNDGWVLPEKAGYRAKIDLTRKNILGIAGLETLEPRTDKPELYSLIQVNEPKDYQPADEAAKSDPGPILARLLDDKGQVLAAVIVGKVKTRELGSRPAEIHVRKLGEARAWLAKGRVDLPADAGAWLDKDMVKIERARVAAAHVQHADGEKLDLVRTNAADGTSKDDFRPSRIPAGKKVASQYDVNSLPGALAFISFDDVAKADSQDFSKATLSVIETLDGIRVSIKSIPAADKKAWITLALDYDPALVKQDAENTVLLNEEAAKKQVADSNARLQGWTYLVSEYTARDITRRLADLLEDDKPKEEKKD